MKIQPALISFAIFVAVLAALPFGISMAGYPNLLMPYFWGMFAYITGLTFLIVMAILFTQKINPENYAQVFLAGTTFKILACLAFMVIFLMKNKVEKGVFAGNFFYLYFLNTAFEVYVLLRNLRNQNLK
ncbi:hypothetical protein ACVW0P_000064 [Mucilaginibacter sp. UYNi724]